MSDSSSDIINNMNNIKIDLRDDMIHIMKNKVVKLSNRVEVINVDFKQLVNKSIRSFGNEITEIVSIKISTAESMFHSVTKNIGNCANDSINMLKNELITKISSINDRMSTNESSISSLSLIMQEYIQCQHKTQQPIPIRVKRQTGNHQL